MDYRDELLRYILRIVGNQLDAEDLVQDTLLTSIEKRSTLKDNSLYKSWLFRVARNKSIDFLKEKNKITSFKADYTDVDFIEEYCDCKTIKTLAENNIEWYDKIKKMYLEEKKSIEEIRAFIISLNPDIKDIPIEYMQAMIYSELDNMSQVEIAKKISAPLATVKARIQRTRQKIKKIFFSCCDFEFDSRGSIVDYKKSGT